MTKNELITKFLASDKSRYVPLTTETVFDCTTQQASAKHLKEVDDALVALHEYDYFEVNVYNTHKGASETFVCVDYESLIEVMAQQDSMRGIDAYLDIITREVMFCMYGKTYSGYNGMIAIERTDVVVQCSNNND